MTREVQKKGRETFIYRLRGGTPEVDPKKFVRCIELELRDFMLG